MSEETKTCPQCESLYGYATGENSYACPECGHEWTLEELLKDEALVVKDSNGTILQNGDSVIVIKNLPVKGASLPIKAVDLKVKNIRLTDGDHNIDCKIEGYGAYGLKIRIC